MPRCARYLFHGMIGTALIAFFGEPSTTLSE
jgi:hypothetical protein